jgi:hypothetical protein
MGPLWKIFTDNRDIILMYPVLFAAAVFIGWLAGWAIIRLVYNQRLAHQADMIANLRAVLEEKLPTSFLPPIKRSGPMSLPLILGGLILVLIGLLIAASGVGWQMYRGSRLVANVVAPQPNTPAVSVQVKVRTNPYDIPKKLAAIDEILPLLRDERIVNRGLQLQSNWRNFLTADRQKYTAELVQYRAEWQAFTQRLADLKAANQNYEDITSLLNQEYQKAYADSFSRFQGAIGSIGEWI